MNMRFVIDEASWQFDQMTLDSCCSALDQLMDQIELASEQNHKVCYSEELFWKIVWGDKTFYDLLAPDSGFMIPRELNERLSSLIYALPKWQDLSEQPQADTSIVWATKQILANKKNAVACLALPLACVIGCRSLNVGNHTIQLWIVADHASYQEFFRWLITETSNDYHEMARFSHSAFLQLDFYENAFSGIARMSKPYGELVNDLVRHLAALSDYGSIIFQQPWDEVPAHFGKHGVDLSMESGKTKQNKDAMNQRTLTHQGENITFLWHTKLERHQNRIHFYPNNVRTGGPIIIGIFCEHLAT